MYSSEAILSGLPSFRNCCTCCCDIAPPLPASCSRCTSSSNSRLMVRSSATRAASLLEAPGLCGDLGVETPGVVSCAEAFCWELGVRGNGGAAIGYLVGGVSEEGCGWWRWPAASGEFRCGGGESTCDEAAGVCCAAGACAGTLLLYGPEA